MHRLLDCSGMANRFIRDSLGRKVVKGYGGGGGSDEEYVNKMRDTVRVGVSCGKGG